MSKVVVLTNSGKQMTVDDNWFAYVNQWSWNESESGYAYRMGHDNKRIMLHRLIMGNPLDKLVDHIDRNPLNNQFENLRLANHQQSRWNRGKFSTNKSGFIGVSIASNGRYRVNICQDGVKHHLGYFFDPIQAALIYDEFIHFRRGDFGVLNFPQNVVDGRYVKNVPAGGETDDA